MKKETLYKIHQIVLLILYIALMVFFAVKCLETGIKSTESSQRVVDATANIINGVTGKETVDPTSSSFKDFVRKFIGHYSYFVLLGSISTLLYLSFRKKFKDYILILISFVVGALFAIATEFLLEGKTQGRGASWMDVGIDFLGFLTLSIIIIGVYYIIKFKRRNRKEEA